MRAFYTDHFMLPLPDGHRFPMAKYGRLRERLKATDVLPTRRLQVPEPASTEELTRVHDPVYVRSVVEGSLDRLAIRRIGFPWSPELVERSRRSVGATIAACRAALEDGVSVNLAGGTHHAGVRHGEGYCVFNDAAVAARALLGEPVRFGAGEHDEGSFYVMLHGLAQHDAYHTGQIAMLKRAGDR